MDPDPFIIGFILAAVSSFVLNLSKSQFALIEKQWDDDKEADPIVAQIHLLWQGNLIPEIIGFGRLTFNTLAILFAISTWPRFFALHHFTLMTPIYWALFLSVFFLLTFILPNIIAHLKPNSLATYTYKAFMPYFVTLWIPAWFFNRSYWYILEKFNYQSVFDFLSEEEKKELNVDAESPEENLLEEEGREMIRNIFEFADRQVFEVMTPRIEIVALNLESSIDEVISLLNQEKPTRIPVYQNSLDHVVGVLYSKDFLEWITQHSREDEFKLSSIIRPAFFVSKTKEIDDLMKEFRLTRNHMAIVLDDFGGTAGLVTLEDIIEEIVGEIYDEEDFEEKIIEEVKEGTYLVDPIISLNDLEKEINIEIPNIDDHEVETLNGLIQSILQDMPRRGARVTIDPLDIKILKVDNRKIKRVLLTIINDLSDQGSIGHS